MEIDRAAAGTPVGPSLQSLNDLKMAESLLKEGRMLGVKAFAIATTMCISGAVLVVGGTRWALDVETVRKFISILSGGPVILPFVTRKQKTKLLNTLRWCIMLM